MLNFENLDGFVIDLTTEEKCNEIIETICDGDAEYLAYTGADIQTKREYIVQHYTDTYCYVFCKQPHVYQICETELEERKYFYENLSTTLTEINSKYNLIKIKREDLVEYYVEKKGYTHLFFICGIYYGGDIEKDYILEHIEFAEKEKFWGEDEDE